MINLMNKKNNNQNTIIYKWIEFIDISINEIILNNIINFLWSKNKKDKKVGVLKNWTKVYKISRSWYRLLELPKKINIKNIPNDSNYNYCWYFTIKWNYYIIASEEINIDEVWERTKNKVKSILDN